MNLLAELRRRNVIRMAGLYLVCAWLILQVTGTVSPMLGAPEWVGRTVLALLAIGFPLVLAVAWVFELTPEGLKRDAEVPAGETIAPQTARRMDRMIIVVLALALGYFAVDKFVLAPARDASSALAAAMTGEGSAATSTAASDVADALPGTANAIDAKSIAVLAFADLSQGRDQEYFSDGVAEEILNALARIDGLKVAGRTSSFYFKGRNEPLATIGSTLGVAHVLEGSVRKQGDRLRISAQLLRVSDGVQMWSETFDGTDADIFALQEQIAQQVTSEMKVALNAGQADRLVEVGTTNADAYALFLRASDIFNKRLFERYDEASRALDDALRLDPSFARAHSRRAVLLYAWAGSSPPARHNELVEQVAASANEAMRLDPTLGEPHAALGVIYASRREYAKARAEFERALQLEPSDATANLWGALFSCNTGYIEQCKRALERTLAIDPLLPNALNWRARLWASEGDLAQAQRMLDRAREVGLGWPGGATGYVIATKRGDRVAAREYSLEVREGLSVGLPAGTPEVFADAAVGDAEAITRARAIIDDYLDSPSPPIPSDIPVMLIHIGDIERGLQVFARYRTTSDTAFLGNVLGTRLYPEASASPAFPAFLRDTGIAAYWDEFGPPEHCRKLDNGDYLCE
jgi:TolB-like protein/Tfp pilus assembly protein PilF